MTSIDYKDANMLRDFLTVHGKIRARRQTGTCAPHQRQLATAVKRARHLALLPFVGD
jgi:small subunit ribosomal protein S18